MDFDLTRAQQYIRSLVREFAEERIAPVAEGLDEREEFPTDLVREMGTLGVMGLPFPEQYGGSGAGTLAYCLALEELARIDSSMAITVEANVSLGGMPLYLFGDETQKQRWLVPLARGEVLGAFGLTEPSGGSDAAALKTRAHLENGDWVVNGTKSFITNAGTPLSAFVTVAAVTDPEGGKRGISNILIPNGTPGYTQAKPYRKLGWHASDTRELSFVDCRVPEDHLIGERGRGYAQFLKVLEGGRIGVAAIGVGLAQGALEQSVRYARQRVAFGKPIAEHQAIEFKLADMATRVELARLITWKAAVLHEHGRPCAREANMAKLCASEIAVRCAEEGVQIHGGYGYMDEAPISRFYRDAKILTIGEGTSEVLRMLIGRCVVGEFRD